MRHLEARHQEAFGPIDLVWDGAVESCQPRDPDAGKTRYQLRIVHPGSRKLVFETETTRPYYDFTVEEQRAAFGYAFDDSLLVSLRALRSGQPAPRWPAARRIEIARDYRIAVALAGQSNVEAYVNALSTTPSLGHAATTLRRALADALGLPIYEVAVFNLAAGGTAMDRAARWSPEDRDYWYDLERQRPGPLLRRARQWLAPWPKVDAILWAQGERETYAMALGQRHPGEPAPSLERWRAATEAVWADLRKAAGNPDLPIVVQGLGRYWLKGREANQIAREHSFAVQQAMIRDDPNVYFGANLSDHGIDFYEEGPDSKVHYRPESYHRLAETVAPILAGAIRGERVIEPWPAPRVAMPEGLNAWRRGGANLNHDEDILLSWRPGDAGPPAKSFYVCLLDSVTREVKAAGITEKTSMVLTEAAQRKLYGTTMSMIYFEVVGQALGERDSTAASLAITLN